MQETSKSKRFNRIIYICIFWLGLNFFLSASKVEFENSDIIRYIVGVVLIGLVFAKRYFRFKKIDLLILGVCILYYFILSQSVALNIIILYLLSYHLQDEELDSVKNNLLKILAILMAIWILLLLTHVIPDQIYTSFGRTRHDLGFTNINQSSVLYLPFLLLLFDRFKIKIVPVVLLASFVLYRLTNTRTSLYVVVLYIGLYYLVAKVPFNKMRINKIIIVITTVLSVLFMRVDLIIKAFPYLDLLFTTRLSIISNQLRELGLLNYIFGGHELLLDNSFVIITSAFGFIGLLIFMKLVKNTLDCNANTSWAYLVAVLAYGFMESIIIIPESVVAILFFTYLQKSRSIRETNLNDVN